MPRGWALSPGSGRWLVPSQRSCLTGTASARCCLALTGNRDALAQAAARVHDDVRGTHTVRCGVIVTRYLNSLQCREPMR